ncbi:unnamed protein product [Psylliodes chrysocephalus]|uniref:Nucleic-acid-binding protein from transposon X-element n=1 Tax=Psylliodes chrysocephalus TaxID=3402493 RepID=A0A9P0CFF5_9CUCU|nr:unnamed protein product [Psylliodes chrysocephala]
MKTKNRPLYLIVTDPAITLDYLNRNVRVISNTRITWELRRSVKMIIQCHNCQLWGHATSNCGRASRCLKCAGDHHTRACLKTRETPANCANCGGDHPANYSKCPNYVERIERLELKKAKSEPKKYSQAPPPKVNAWKERETNRPSREHFPALPNRGQNQNSAPPQPSQPRTSAPRAGDGFNELNAELDELNRLVNLSELARAVRDLNNLLRACPTNKDLFTAYQDFYDNINSYKFRN